MSTTEHPAASSRVLEQRTIREKCLHPAGGLVAFPRDAIERTIPALFEQQVLQHPGHPAVKTAGSALTYAQLNQMANRLARLILAETREGNAPILLLMEKSALLIGAIVGVLKAGKIVTPVEPSYPRPRLAAILGDSEASVIVTDTRNLALAVGLSRNTIPVIDAEARGAGVSPENPGTVADAETLAYLLYTSGSTGEPKGVMQAHRDILHNVMAYTNDLHISPNDRLSLIHSCSFSASTRNIFGALLNGASVFPFDLKEEGLPNLASWLNREGITILHSPASVFRHLVGAISDGDDFPSVRALYIANEPVSRQEVEFYRSRFSSGCVFTNALAVSEVHTVCRYFMDQGTPLIDGAVPVGYPPEDKEVLLLDEEGHRVEGEGVGEIAVRSRYNCPGYWRRPELTSAAFQADPTAGGVTIYRTGDLGRRLADGCLLHMGRKDFQVKIGGSRVDTLEVEQTLREHRAIRDAVVVARESQSGDRRLIAYLVPVERPGPDIRELRRFLGDRLADHMTPSQFVVLDALPRNLHGKVDRLALPAPSVSRPELDIPYVPPRTPVETALAEMWRSILGLDSVGIRDNFLDLGGTSLQAAQVVSSVFREYSVVVPLSAFWKTPTVESLALFVVQLQAAGLPEQEIERLLREVEGPPAGTAS